MKYLQAIRIQQWSKNLLVLVAPFAAGHVFHYTILSKTLYAFLAFSTKWCINMQTLVELSHC